MERRHSGEINLKRGPRRISTKLQRTDKANFTIQKIINPPELVDHKKD